MAKKETILTDLETIITLKKVDSAKNTNTKAFSNQHTTTGVLPPDIILLVLQQRTLINMIV
jgi:hypothetical protein